MGKIVGTLLGVLALVAILLSAPFASASPPFDRQITWTNPTTATDNMTLIPATDNLVTHVFHCSALLDNTTCTEIGVSAANATTLTVPSPQRPNSTAWYAARTEWKEQGTTSAYSNLFQFFLQGWQAKPPRLDSAN
ncbi:MAG: hypothetical protein M0T69_02210 [Deltaproteobacteria bacterium]|nr:hypothetical protein [Deltaproteobacteria bacterium]